MGLTLWWQERIHPEDREVCGIHNVIDSGGQIWSDEHRFLLADNLRLAIGSGFVAHDDQVPVRMIGSMMDIGTAPEGREGTRMTPRT